MRIVRIESALCLAALLLVGLGATAGCGDAGTPSGRTPVEPAETFDSPSELLTHWLELSIGSGDSALFTSLFDEDFRCEATQGGWDASDCLIRPDFSVPMQLEVEVLGDEGAGMFQLANGGTIFLDEVGEMSPAMQLRLLRVLQEGEIRRVGAATTRTVDVRVLAATNADLEDDVHAGRFRKDLYYRLNVFPIHLPPLRDRVEDIPALVDQFLKTYRERARRAIPTVSADALALLRSYPFPGNVRELENEIERAVALAENGQPIRPEHISERIRASREKLVAPVTLGAAIEQLKRRMIEDALRECGSKTRAAERLGLTRQSLQQMLRRRQA
jgi:hypothetical protein